MKAPAHKSPSRPFIEILDWEMEADLKLFVIRKNGEVLINVPSGVCASLAAVPSIIM